MPTFAAMNQNENAMNEKVKAEVLLFRRAAGVATIVTNGEQTRVYTEDGWRAAATLRGAIAWLECRGYNIETDAPW